jgi:hypothetical protein
MKFKSAEADWNDLVVTQMLDRLQGCVSDIDAWGFSIEPGENALIQKVIYTSRMQLRVLAMSAALSLCAVGAWSQDGNPDDKVAQKSAWLRLTPEQKTQVFQFAEPYKDYLRHAKSAGLSTVDLTRLAKRYYRSIATTA